MSKSSQNREAPNVDYLTRDYRGFRDQLLELVTRSRSPWSERSPADVGVMLLEALAYRLDLLAYAGDAVAREGFLRTARSRQSARLHAALGDHVLDRGSTSRGYQHFAVSDGELILPAHSSVGPPLEPQQDPADRDVFETMVEARLDARHNRFTLRKTVRAGSKVLWLGGPRREALDLWALGLRPDMPLALVSRDHAELVTIARVQGSAVVLTQPSSATFLADESDRSGRVVGNLVPIRRGRQTGWKQLGRGGIKWGDGSPAIYFAQRVALVQALGELVERLRDAWYARPDLEQAWQAAQRAAGQAVCRLRREAVQTLSERESVCIDRLLGEAADALRSIVATLGSTLPAALRKSCWVAIPRQRVPFPADEPPLWLDRSATLVVRTLVGGQTAEWSEVEDFLRSGPSDRHYVVEIVHERDVALRFGDGKHGAMVPPGAWILARWIVGDPGLGDVGRGALTRALGPEEARLDPRERTFNPLPTSCARPPEPLETVADRVRHDLSVPAIPVTADDYVQLFEQQPGVIEAVALPRALRLARVAVRLEEQLPVTETLALLQRWGDEHRLAGTHVRVTPARALYVSVTATIQLHAEADPEAVQARCRAALRAFFSPTDERQMGVPCDKARVLALLEAVNGVEWSELHRFSRASAQGAGGTRVVNVVNGVDHDESPRRDRALPGVVQEVIRPAADQVLRCLDEPETGATGRIQILVIREYSLVVEYRRIDPDAAPDEIKVHAALSAALSGPGSIPVTEAWTSLSPARIGKLLARGGCASPGFTLHLRALIRGERRVDEIPLREGDVPTLRTLQLITTLGGAEA